MIIKINFKNLCQKTFLMTLYRNQMLELYYEIFLRKRQNLTLLLIQIKNFL